MKDKKTAVYDIENKKLLNDKDSEIIMLKEENELLKRMIKKFIANSKIDIDGFEHNPPLTEGMQQLVYEYYKRLVMEEIENELKTNSIKTWR